MEENNLNTTYGFNNNKEKVEVYTKGDFAVITTQVVADEDSNRRGSTKVRLPKGFYSSNTIILGVIYSFNADFFPANFPYNFYNNGGSYKTPELLVQLGDTLSLEEDASEIINITLNSTSITAGPQMVYVRLVLMKMSDVIEDVRPIKVGDNLVGGSDNLIYFDMNPISNDDAENNRVIITGTNGTIFERVNGQQVQLVMSSEGDEEVIGGKGGSGLIVCGIAITYGIGVVTSVNTESPYYQYIRIKETND